MSELKKYLSEKEIHIVSETLISLVSGFPCIYDKTSENYKDPVLKRKKFREFVTLIHNSSGIEVLEAEHLYKLWKELLNKFKSIHIVINKVVPSGTSADNVSAYDWKFYKLMSFCEPHISPRPITSSLAKSKASNLQGNHVTPPLEQFARKKKAKIDDIDSQLIKTSQLVDLTLERVNCLAKADAQESVHEKKISNSKSENKNAYFEAVMETFKTIPDVHWIPCLMMVLEELRKLKSQYNA